MPSDESPLAAKADRYLPAWGQGDLPRPPRFSATQWGTLIGPGLLMVGSTIGGGEWLFGPIVTARYGGMVMWIAAVSIAFQVFFNLSVMRYALYSGEPIFVGFLRTAPGPKFWIVFYIIADLGYVFPYVASNAAVQELGAGEIEPADADEARRVWAPPPVTEARSPNAHA